jgi:hypothetical protein
MSRVAAIALACLLAAGCATTHKVTTRSEEVAADVGTRTREVATNVGTKTREVATVATHPELNATAIDHPEKEGVPGVVQAPFEDANLIRIQIPPVLLEAQKAPYARPDPASCSQIADDVRDLDDALGDDFDSDQPEDVNVDAKHGRQAGELMVSAMRDTTEDLIPFRSWVRRLSGAQAHANIVRTAVYAGRVRRAYLKGLGEAIGCRFPAAPKGASPLPVVKADPPRRRHR